MLFAQTVAFPVIAPGVAGKGQVWQSTVFTVVGLVTIGEGEVTAGFAFTATPPEETATAAVAATVAVVVFSLHQEFPLLSVLIR